MSADDFERHRDHLFGIAYRMLGSATEADDVLQDAFLRWNAAPRDEIANPRAYLTRVVTRLCLDALKSARMRRERYVGPWLPEPLATTTEQADVASLSMAFLVLLERLTPLERAAFLLHEVFDHGHAEVADVLGRSEAACRQLVSRARGHIRGGRPRFACDRESHAQLVAAFLHAALEGDLDRLRALLADEAAAWSDSGGKAVAARRPVQGADRVARFFVGLARKAPRDVSPEMADINGRPAVVVRLGDAIESVLCIETDGRRIQRVDVVVNPDKLHRLAADLAAGR